MAKKYTPPHIKKSKQGSLHTAVGVKQGDKIPASKLIIKKNDSPALRKKKQFALNARKWSHETGGYAQYGATNLPIDQWQPTAVPLPGGPYDPNADQAQQNNQVIDRGSLFANEAGTDEYGSGERMFQRNTGISHLDPNVERLNGAISFATGIGNMIQNNRLKRQERLQNLEGMTPKYMINEEAQGLDNVPAYTQYGGQKKMGGPIKHGSPVGVVNFKSSKGYHDKEMDTGIRHQAFYDGGMEYEGGEPFMFQAGGRVFEPSDESNIYYGEDNGSNRKFLPRGQAGTAIPPGPNPSPINPQATPPADPNDPNGEYAANATLAYFKEQLNQKLRAKNPDAYDKYQSGFNSIQNKYKTGQLPATQVIPARQQYVASADYNEALTPEEVQASLGSDYQTYLNSLKIVNQANVSRGQKPLYGDIEGDQDITKLNYGRRFAAVTTNPSVSATIKNKNGVPVRTVNTNYTYNPNARKVDSAQRIIQYDAAGNPITKQAGGYAVGEEVQLTAKQIAALKKQGYKIQNI